MENFKGFKPDFKKPLGFKKPPLADVSKIKNKFLDLPYGNESKAQVLDLYLPENGSKPYPVLIYIHGGGFALGDKRDDHINDLLSILDQGWALAGIEYRLSGEAIFPAAVYDCKSAIKYLRANCAKYNLDSNNFFSLGGSAGGNLSAMMAVSKGLFVDPQGQYNDYPDQVNAAVDWFGPTDFKVMDQQAKENGFSFVNHDEAESAESTYLGQPISSCSQELCDKANPITYISDKMVPIFVEYGDHDHLVPPQQSKILVEAIEKKVGKDKVQYHILKDADHEDKQFTSKENLQLVWDFLNHWRV